MPGSSFDKCRDGHVHPSGQWKYKTNGIGLVESMIPNKTFSHERPARPENQPTKQDIDLLD